jgi:hypothetical protein
MYTRFIATMAAIVLSVGSSAARAQCGCDFAETAYAPAVPSYSSYTAYAPVVPSYSSYFAPTVAYYAPPPYISYYAQTTTYVGYSSPYVAYSAPVVRPWAAYYGVPGWSVFGAPRAYVAGQPVRNVLRAVTP